ncbi:hypothetical protein ASPZODRAFT_62240 [Penicilliopsis zonata CBS 506.65]|uniref:Tricalbin n=1 Tax=Penicilliopsis zonata CBS 506.65 TaxID=1073090 RepID=A0A1L9SLI4_9EURO|nr:hypothetical protein ASPZODRAFT_62240 [Penicilliopsis zonata CBS 506.65]OJJ48132.1 hypothetical protein ASPZODRAFT_62240 [Penicilliopsis zonata CBS 506.65]
MASLDADQKKAEYKQQGAIAAAQEAALDPQSSVRPETVEKVLVDETRKAGLPAFQFDPDATPEQKAAAARSRVSPDLHHEKKPQGVAVVTDLNDGTPAKYNLPTPPATSELLKEPPAVPEPGKPVPPGELTEDLRWARDRTGWAPQFETQKIDGEEDEGTLLEHQTLLEGKLDDKFFGDWYHNAGIIVFACLASWLVAVLGGGLGWIFIVMAACSTYYRTSIRRVRRNFRDDIHREMAKQRLETDTESLEWINSFLVKFWPIYAPVLCDTIINSVDQVLSTATPAMLDSLRLKTFILGTKPPRLEHVKTYPKTEVDTVLMDWKFSFTPTDTLDMTARQIKNKINPKIVLEVRIGKGLVSKGLDVIVENMACSGLMRVKVKLQIPFPHIERVEVCFLERPDFDYVCKPLGGDMLGFDINFIPGLENFIKDQIHANIGPMMYAPNVFPVEIAKMLAGNPVDQAIGVAAVTLHGAQQLRNSDKFAGTLDPYAIVSLNNRTELGRTKTVQDTDSPRWGETIYVILTSFTDVLTMQVYDWNEFRKDKELGVASFALDRLQEESEHESLYLEVSASGRSRGAVHADIRFFPVLEGRTLEGGATEPPPELNTGIARFTVEQAKDLDGTKSLVGQLNPYAVLLLNGKEIHVTKKLKRTNNPIFQDASKEFLVTDRKNAKLGLVIKDDRDLMADPILGSYQIKLPDLLKMMEKGQEWFQLAGAKTGRAKLTLQWKSVAVGGISGSAGYLEPIGVMRFHFQNARDLRNLETMGKSDPYARVLLSGVMKGRTVTFRNNLNPDWDEVVYVPIHSIREKLTIEVMDEESLGKDRSLGATDLSAADFVHEGENGEYLVDDEKQLTSSNLRLGSSTKGKINYTVAFYPTVPVVNPDDEVEEEETANGEAVAGDAASRKSLDARSKSGSIRHSKSVSVDSKATNGVEAAPAPAAAAPTTTTTTTNGRLSVETNGSKPTTGKDSDSQSMVSVKEVPKIFISAEDLSQYESGFLVFKFHEAQLSRTNVQLEVLMDDYMFPSYVSPRLRSRSAKFEDVGDAFIRELEFSKITLRLVEKNDGKDEGDDHTVAKLTGDTLPTLQRILYTPTELTLRSDSGEVSKVTVSARYIPAKMKLDPRESINNMGTLRVDVLDAADLPSADRNGYSDPYCKFKLEDKEVHKTKVQKKTLHPAWNEFFETPVKSRIGSDFRVDVYDWDFGDSADYLGGTPIDLTVLDPFVAKEVTLPLDGKSGAIRLKMLFKPSYVMRSRQGSSTFISGTFAAPGKIVGAPVKGVGMVGGGVLKGASFLKHGLMSRIHKNGGGGGGDDAASVMTTGSREESLEATSSVVPPVMVDGATPTTPPSTAPTTPQQLQHSRNRSLASQFGDRLSVSGTAPGSGGTGAAGTATITVVSASGFAPSTNVRVHVKTLNSKGAAKEVHKTKAHKVPGSGGPVQFDASHETVRVSHTTADAQYQLRVVDHSTFGSDELLGESLFFVDDQGSVAGQEKSVKVGNGVVNVRSSFAPSGDAANSLRPSTSHSQNGDGPSDVVMDSPDSRREKAPRRSFLGKRSVSGV